MMLALREVKPNLFPEYISFAESVQLNSELVEIERFLRKDTPETLRQYLKVMLGIKIETVLIKGSNPQTERDIWLLNPNNEYLQTVGCSNDMSHYVQRITRQSVLSNELREQDIIQDILKLTELPLSAFLEEWLSFDEYKQEKYSQFIFLKFNNEQRLAYQELGNGNLSDQLSSTKCRHVIKFVHYLAKQLTLENIYEIFNQLLYTKDDREYSNALINYLGYNEQEIPIEIEPLIHKLNSDKNKRRYLLLSLKQSYELYHARREFETFSESAHFHSFGRKLSDLDDLKKPVLSQNSKLSNASKLPNILDLYNIAQVRAADY
jgi:hypothetical protein